jgi:hypothetical protein
LAVVAEVLEVAVAVLVDLFITLQHYFLLEHTQ